MGDNYYSGVLPRAVDAGELGQGQAQLEQMPLDALPPVATLPAGSRMPHARNPLFVGRAEDLQRLARALKGGQTAAIGQIAAATGLGGIGKSQLAVEFAHRYGAFFAGGVLWVSLADPAGVASEVVQAGQGLGLHPQYGALPQAEQLALVAAAWQSALPRLLIFDNCEEEELLAQWRPPTGGCRVLVTSRRAEWEAGLGVAVLALGVLERAESVALLGMFRPDLRGVQEAELRALAAEVGADAGVKAAVLAKLEDAEVWVRSAAVEALGPQVGADAGVRSAVLAKLEDGGWPVRRAAVEALGPQVVADAAMKAAVLAKLSDGDTRVRASALRILSASMTYGESRVFLENVLGSSDNTIDRFFSAPRRRSNENRREHRNALIKSWATRIEGSDEAFMWARSLLHSDNPELRESGALLLQAAGPSFVSSAKADLLAAADNWRGPASWPARFAAAERLLNEWGYAAKVLPVLLSALDYGVKPPIVDLNAAGVRKQAALILGKLKAIEHYPEVTDRIRVMLEDENDPEVLDALASALRSLTAVPKTVG